MSLEILALLASRPARLEVGDTSDNALRPEDVAAFLAGLPENVYLYGLYMVVQDRSFHPELVSHAYHEVVNLAIERGWRAPRGSEIFRRMALLALCESMGFDCSDCAKRGTIYDENGIRSSCPTCHGTGLRPIAKKEREEALGVTGQRWLARYERVYCRIGGWRMTLEDHLRRCLINETESAAPPGAAGA